MGASDLFEPGSDESKQQDWNRNFSGGKLISGRGVDLGYGLGIYTPEAVEDWMRGPAVPNANPVTYDWSRYDKNSQQQQDMNAMLLARAQGRGGPSVAETQLHNTTQAVQRNAAAQAASARGGAMQQQAAARNAQAQSVQSQQEAAGQGAQVRAQEQQAATGQYMQALNAQQNAELQRQLQMGQTQVAQTGAESQRIQMQRQQQQAGVGGVVGAVGGLVGAMSDKRAKTDIHPAEQDIAEMFDALHAKRFQYKPGFGESGEHLGVMAQDLERTPAGRTLVEHDSGGMRRIDPQRALMSLLAAGADIYDRLRKLEGVR